MTVSKPTYEELKEKVQALDRKVAQLRQAQEKTAYREQVLDALRRVNRLIIRETDQDRLVQRACDILIEARGYFNAWIALLDETGGLAAAAESGLGEDFLPLAEQLKRGKLPACARQALAQTSVVAVRDPSSVCTDCLLAASYAGWGAMSVRLEHAEKVFGLLTVSVPADFAASEQEQALFEDVAGDIAFALHDIQVEAARKQAEKMLARKEAKIRATLYSIGDAVIVTDDQGRVTRLNPVAEKLTGWTESDAGGRALDEVFDIINEQTRQKVKSPAARVMREGTVVGLANHTLLITKDGREIPIADAGSPILDPQGNITGVVLVFRDQAEERLAARLTDIHLSLIEYAAEHTLDELLTRSLDEIGALAESPIGFYHFVAPDQKTFSLQQWSTRTMKEFCRAEGKGMHYSIDQAGVWTDCVHAKKPVIHNDYASLPHKKGMPDGHAEVIRELVVPVMREDQVVAILGMGNKPVEYTQKDVEIVSYLADVTWEVVRQKRTAEELARTAKEWQTTFDATKDAVWIIDQDQRIVRCNRTSETLFQRPRQELIGRYCWEVVHGTSEPIPECPMLRAEKSRQRETMELQIGSRWFQVTVDPILNDAGMFDGAVHIISDITERRQTEQALKESQERLEMAVKGANLGLWDWNVQTGDAVFSDRWARMLGYELDELAPHADTWEALIHPDDKESVFSVLNRHFEDDDFEYNTRFRLKTKAGDWKWINSRGRVFERDEDKKPVRMVGSHIDITERRQRERALKKSEEKYRDLVESTADWVWSCDPVGRQTFANPAVKTILGYEPHKIVGAKADRFMHPEDAGRSQKWLKKATADKKGWKNSILRWKHKDGTTRVLESTARPILDAKGELVGFSGIDRDITERRKLEQELQQTQKMEAIGTLAGGVAHDFNNFLTIILGNADMMLMEIKKEHPLYKEINGIRKAASGAASLTRQLLAFSRKQVIVPKIMNLNDVINATVKMLRRLIGENIDLQTLLDPDLKPVEIDSGQMDQIIINLAVNARDAMPLGGKLTISTQSQKVSADFFAKQGIKGRAGAYIIMQVSDTGSGMSKETLAHIFEPFFTTKGLERGTGLGLATVYGIVKQNHGYIFVESEPEKGSVFKIYLPVVEEKKTSAAIGTPACKGFSGTETILVVEDDVQLQKLTARILEDCGYRTLCASNGHQAVKISNEYDGTIHLILSDVIMPGMNVLDMAAALQARRKEARMLYMSGYLDDTVSRFDMIKTGKNFLQKPFGPEVLARKVREILDRKD